MFLLPIFTSSFDDDKLIVGEIMRFVNNAIAVAIALSISGCSTVRKQAETEADPNNGFSAIMRSSKNAAELKNYNQSLAVAYLDAADRASQASHISDALLITTAAVIVHGGAIAAGSQLQSNRLLFGLTLTEGIRYASPNQVARAFKIAGKQAMCIAAATDTNSDEDAIKQVMYASNSNLRQRIMVRKPINIGTLIKGFEDGKAILQEDKIEAENELAAASTETKKANAKMEKALAKSAVKIGELEAKIDAL